MISLLSDILQYVLDSSVQTVSLKEEMAHIRSYVEIQRMRYKDRFRLLWDVPESLTDRQLLKLSLQPLLENSLQYGLECKEWLNIKIKARSGAGGLKLTVIDDGPGIEAGRLRELRNALAEDIELTGQVGLSNTSKRLRLQYGDQVRIRILSRPGAGTAITLHVPLQTARKDTSDCPT